MPDFGPVRGAIERLLELMQERTAPEAQRLLPPMQESRGQLIIPPHAQMPTGLQVQAPPQVPLPSDVADPSRRQFFRNTAARVLSSPVLQSRFALSPIARFLMEDSARQSVSAQDAVQRVGAALPGAWKNTTYLPTIEDVRKFDPLPDWFQNTYPDGKPVHPEYYKISPEELAQKRYKEIIENNLRYPNPNFMGSLYDKLEKSTNLDPRIIEQILPPSDIESALSLDKREVMPFKTARQLYDFGNSEGQGDFQAPWRQLFLDPSGSFNYAWDVATEGDPQHPLRKSLVGPQLLESQLPGYFGRLAKLWPDYRTIAAEDLQSNPWHEDDPLESLRTQLRWNNNPNIKRGDLDHQSDLDADAIWRILNNMK